MPRSIARFARCITLVLIAAGCSGDSGQLVAFRDSAGVTIVQNVPDAAERVPLWRVSSEPRLTIGGLDGPPAYQLFRVGGGGSGAVRLNDGRIGVLNAGTSEVRFFTAEGTHLASAGLKGDGPGELRDPSGALHLAHDTIGVFDPSNQRFTMFAADGGYRTVRLDRPTTNPLIVGAFADGSIVMADHRIDIPESGFLMTSGVLTSYSSDGSFSDTLGSFPWLEIGVLESPVRIGARTFAPRTSLALHGDRFLVGTARDPSVDVHDRRGKLVRRIRWEAGDRTVGPNDPAAFFARAYPSSTPERRRRFELTPVERQFPAYSGLITDALGNLWVQLYRRPTDDGPSRWLVFNGDGTMIARVELPAAFRPMDIGHDFILGVHPGEMDVERVVLHSLER